MQNQVNALRRERSHLAQVRMTNCHINAYAVYQICTLSPCGASLHFILLRYCAKIFARAPCISKVKIIYVLSLSLFLLTGVVVFRRRAR